MSVESLKLRKDVSWISPNDERFGPPVYDEKPRSYKWRVFKRGFTWGIYSLFILLRIHVISDLCGTVRSVFAFNEAWADRRSFVVHITCGLWIARWHCFWNI